MKEEKQKWENELNLYRLIQMKEEKIRWENELNLYRLIQMKEEKERWEEELNHLSVTPASAKEMEPRTALRQVFSILLFNSKMKNLKKSLFTLNLLT